MGWGRGRTKPLTLERMAREWLNRGWNPGPPSSQTPRAEHGHQASVPQLPPDTPHHSRNAACEEGGLARLAATQPGLLPPPIHPHFPAGPGVSNPRPRKQRTFSQSWGGGSPVWSQPRQLLQGVSLVGGAFHQSFLPPLLPTAHMTLRLNACCVSELRPCPPHTSTSQSLL